MAEPLSIAAQFLASASIAIQSTKSLYVTIKHVKYHNETSSRLQDELKDLTCVLDSLTQITNTEASMPVLLQGPIELCHQVCHELEQSIEGFKRNPETAFQDWTKIETMRGDVSNCIDTIASCKSTISLCLGTIQMNNLDISHQTLQEYNNIIQDTTDSFKLRLQEIDEKLMRLAVDKPQDGGAETNSRLRRSRGSTVQKDSPENDNERLRLLSEINVSKQCLEICKLASEVSQQRIRGIKSGTIDGDSDQLVLTSLVDLFDSKKAVSQGSSVKLVGSMDEETYLSRASKRYGGRIQALDSGYDYIIDAASKDYSCRFEALDSGYDSMIDAASKSKEQDFDNMSIGSILTNDSRIALPVDERAHLISAFTGDFCQDVGFRRDSDILNRVSARLPDLLRAYSLRLKETANRKEEYDAKEFIRQQRNRIAHEFCECKKTREISEDVNPFTRLDDGMSPAEKIALWNSTEHSEFSPETAPGDKEQEDIKIPPIYRDIRSFLLGGAAYQWLLQNARSSALLTERKGTVLEEISCKIDATLSSLRRAKTREPLVFQGRFDMDWDLVNFLRGQEYGTTLETAIEQAITITGCGSNAQALSCVDYMCQTWPSTGLKIVHALQKALGSPNFFCPSYLVDGMELSMNFGTQNAFIMAHGNQAALTELCEQLAWLGAALRTSPIPSGICLSTPIVTISEEAKSGGAILSIMARFEFTSRPAFDTSFDHDLSNDVAGKCWHAMFRNSMIVDNFPILARRENEQGLELPFGMMTGLAEVDFATSYDMTLVLKGTCTMLIPTRLDGCSITWHFLSNKSGKRIPYYDFRGRCPDWIGTDKVNISNLETGNVRHFVGWSSEITRHLGTEDMEYGAIDWAGAKKCSAGLAVEQRLSISVSKIIGASMSIVRGIRDKPEFIHQSAYSTQIENARHMQVVLYDKEAQRGWLVDGASALLHLVRTQVVREPYGGINSLFNKSSFNHSLFKHPAIDGGPNAAKDMLKEDRNLKHIILREFHSYSDEEINSLLGDKISDKGNQSQGDGIPDEVNKKKEIFKITCLRELVSQTWSTLEQIYDRQIEAASTHGIKQLHRPFDSVLEGYEFMDIVSAKHNLTRRVVKLQSNGVFWLKLTKRINAITLFGQNFGHIYRPTEKIARNICKDWITVPKGHDYLAAPISLLKEIRQHSWKAGEIDENLPEVAEGIFWSLSKDAFNPCTLGCKHVIDRVQQLCDFKVRKIPSKNAPSNMNIPSEIDGAVLFGCSSALDRTKLEILSPEVAQIESSLYDSGVGSSLQSSLQTAPVTPSSSRDNSV